MKKVFLINFSSSILIDVAKKLRDQGIDIVYWQGHRDDFNELAKTKNGFEKTIFRYTHDAIKNIPPKEIDVSEFEPISQSLIEKMYSYGWQAMSMIARADYANPVFVKRRNVYYGYMKFWYGMIKKLKPDAILFVSVPHSAYSFVLYSLAKLFNIKTIMLGRSAVDSRMLVLSDYKIGSQELQKEYLHIQDDKNTVQDLSGDLRDHYLSQQNMQPSSKFGDGNYEHLVTQNNKMPFKVPTVSTILKNILHFTFFKTVKSYLNMLFSKRKMHYYNEDLTGFKMMIMTRQWSKENKSFEKEYKDLQIRPDYQKKYIYVPLAFQPEQTTCPSGDVFDDQLLMISMISSSVPDDWVIYVKEHLPQWYAHHTEAHLYRYEGYYIDIASMKNVRLVPAETHPYELIKNAQAVATVSGTTGWEAITRSIPALIFGYVWYMYCQGIFRITDAEECKSAIERIKNGYKVDQQQVINYLAALDKVSIKAKNYKTRNFIENKQVNREENVNNISQALHKAIISD